MIDLFFRTSLLITGLCLAVIAQAQSVTTLTSSPFDASGDLSVAADGDIYVANGGDRDSRSLVGEVYRVSATGEVNPFAADLGEGAVGNVFDAQGNLYQTMVIPARIYRISPVGEVAVFAEGGGLNQPLGLAFDSMGNLYVGNCLGQNVLKFTPDGTETVFFSSEPNSCPTGVATDDQDNLYVSYAHTPFITKITPTGEASVFSGTGRWTGTDSGNQHLVYSNDRLYLASEGANRIFEFTMEGDVSILTGSSNAGNEDGPLADATFTAPRGIGVSRDGRKLYVTSRVPPMSSPNSWTPNVIRVIELPGFEDDTFPINAGLNDSWFNPLTNGQGFFIVVYPEIKFFFIAWFTYDTERPPEGTLSQLGEAGHRWITGQGSYEGDTATLDVIVSKGGVFDSPDPAVTFESDGTMTVEFSDCENGLVTYTIASLNLQGSVPIQRIALSNVPLCETLVGSQSETIQ